MAHEVTISTPLGDDELRFRHMSASEELSQLFVYNLILYSENEEIDTDKILGQKVTITLETADGSRYFNGYVTKFGQVDQTVSGDAVYQARVSPWLWFLTRTSDCRIFQEMTVLDIVKDVFKEGGYSGDVKDLTSGGFRKWEYCVQYRETDFNFVSRLLEQEGIYYYFEHTQDAHKLVLANASSSHSPIKGVSKIPYHLPGLGQTVDTEHVSGWIINSEIQPDQVALSDYNFESPKQKMQVMRKLKRSYAKAGLEIYDYPGEYPDGGSGEEVALDRVEELQAAYEQVSGESDARHLATGGLFDLTGHQRSDQNRNYLVLSAIYELNTSDYFSGDQDNSPVFVVSFKAIHSKTPYRAPRSTPKPTVYGPQTAVVVGKSGQEIYPDKYGRVKVQFHWDRYGQKDEKSSCWIRVAQSWAGERWGAQFIPRIGHEVVVEFLEGDPDRPLITGSVYNADNMPTYDLPDNKTQSGIKSRSSEKGNTKNFNEIRMEDKKGKEELFIQAEKNETIEVKNDKKETIGNDETLEVTNDRDRTVKNNEKVSISSNQTIKVGKVLKISAGDEIELKTGMSKISMKKDGKIEISGMEITIKDSAGSVKVGPGGIITIKGPLVKIN